VHDGLSAVAKGHPRLLACEPNDARGESTESLVESVSKDYSSVGIVGIVPLSRIDGGALVRLVQAGAHAILLADDRLTSLDCRRVLTEAVVKSGVSAGQTGIVRAAPRQVRRLLEYGFRYAHEPVTVAMAALSLGVNRKTLFWWCAETGLPAPQQLLGWCRLLAAATLLEDAGRRVDHIALDLDFPSGTALRNLLYRYCGVSPSQLRCGGAVAVIRRQFLAAVSVDS
jgi:AraC-like DNA-binding protein